MKLEPGTFIDFGRERPFVRHLAQAFALVGLLAIAAYRHMPMEPGISSSAVATASDTILPFAHISLHQEKE